MAKGSNNNNNRAAVTGAEQALNQFKYEIANELGLQQQVQDGYWGEIPARQCGAVGGHMVKRMIEMAERSLAGRAGTIR